VAVTGADEVGLAELLAVAIRARLGVVRIDGLRRLTGGASRETWSFDAVRTDGTRVELVLRRDPPSRPGPPGAMALEARAMRCAGEAGVPVPEVLLDTDDTSAWGAAGMVMGRVQGEALGRRILRDEELAAARSLLVAQCAGALADLHRVDPEALGAAPEHDPLAAIRWVLDELGEPVPTFEFALRWLESHRPESSGRGIVHGDFRLGNLMVDHDGLVSVLDWELVHLGDPVEDLGWFCVRAWRFGAGPPVAGLGERRELLDAYARAGGALVDEDVLRWWEAYGTLRWGAICLTQAAVHLRRELRSVELAAIGRRVCETEWDLLLLLQPDAALAALDRRDRDRSEPAPDAVVGSAQTAPDLPAGRSPLHGRPTSIELIEAVREFLTDRVVAAELGPTSYHARVAANALAIVERELAAGPAPHERRARALARLGVQDEAELCHQLRSGAADLNTVDVVDVLCDGVVERVSIANPRYLRRSDR